MFVQAPDNVAYEEELQEDEYERMRFCASLVSIERQGWAKRATVVSFDSVLRQYYTADMAANFVANPLLAMVGGNSMCVVADPYVPKDRAYVIGNSILVATGGDE